MRVTWLLLPGLAGLALTVLTRCHDSSHRAQARPRAGAAKAAAKKAAVAVAVFHPPPAQARPQPAQAPPAQANPQAANAAPPADDKVVASWEKVEGWGADQEAAVRDAVKNAQKLV